MRLRPHAESSHARTVRGQAPHHGRCAAEAAEAHDAIATDTASSNGAPSTLDAPTILKWQQPNGVQMFWTRAKLAFELPQRRFKKGSYLFIDLEGATRLPCWLRSPHYPFLSPNRPWLPEKQLRNS
jgi:hypothetical protein